jgi:F420H(2)-dependent quinone reductase
VTEPAATGDPSLTPVTPQQWYRIRGPRALTADRWIVHVTGWSYLAWQNCKLRQNPYTPVLLLTTTGRRSGLPRRSVLPYHRFGDCVVVIGSNSGTRRDPDWVDNLRADRRCWYRIGRRDTAALGHLAEGRERAAAFARVLETRPYAQAYEDRTALLGRQMPVVVLAPRPGGATGARA